MIAVERVETRATFWSPFAAPGFRLLFASTAFGAAGFSASALALAWGTLQVTGSPFLLGSVLLVEGLPMALLALFGGAVADRLQPRLVLGAAAALRAVAAGMIGGFALAGDLQLWMLFVAAVAFGAANAFWQPATSALVPSLLGDNVEAGNSLLMGTMTILAIASPALAGLGVAAGGTGPAFLVAGACFAGAAVTGALLPSRDGVGVAAQPLIRAIAAGLRFVAGDPALRSVLLLVAVITFWVEAPFAIGLAVLARERLGGAVALGELDAAFAASTLVGTILVGVVGKTRHMGLVLLAAAAVIGAVMTLFGFVHFLAEALVVASVIGAAAGYVSVNASGWLQRRAPANMKGRVISVAVLANYGLMPISYAASGALAQLRLEVLFVVAGAAVVLATAAAALSRTVREA